MKCEAFGCSGVEATRFGVLCEEHWNRLSDEGQAEVVRLMTSLEAANEGAKSPYDLRRARLMMLTVSPNLQRGPLTGRVDITQIRAPRQIRALKLPGVEGGFILSGTREENNETARVLGGRHAFAATYCQQKGWPTDPAALTFDQILEIRRQPGWKDP